MGHYTMISILVLWCTRNCSAKYKNDDVMELFIRIGRNPENPNWIYLSHGSEDFSTGRWVLFVTDMSQIVVLYRGETKSDCNGVVMRNSTSLGIEIKTTKRKKFQGQREHIATSATTSGSIAKGIAMLVSNLRQATSWKGTMLFRAAITLNSS